MNTAPQGAPAGAPSLTLDTASQAVNLDQLAGVAAGMEAPAGGPPGAPGAAAGLPAPTGEPNPIALGNGQLIGGALAGLRDGFCAFTGAQAPRRIATDQAIGQLSMGWGQWAAGRGWDLKAMFGKDADLIPLAVSTLALAWAVYEATRTELAARRPAKAAERSATDVPEAAPADSQAAPVADAGTAAMFPGQGGA